MRNLAIFTRLLCLFFISITSHTGLAQNGVTPSLQIPPSIQCAPGLETVSQLGLCATKSFERPAYAKLDAQKRCKSGYARVPGLDFCVLNRGAAHIKKVEGAFTISRANRDQCKASFRRAGHARFCIDQRLALHLKDGSLKLDNMAPIDCAEDSHNETRRCKRLCQAGFVKPLGEEICVQWELARDGHVELAKMNQDCSSSRYWMKRSEQGLCLPKFNVSSVMMGDADAIVREAEQGTDCVGTVPQVISVATNTPDQAADSSRRNSAPQSSSAASGIGGFKIIPVVMCSNPEWIRFLH